MEKLTYKASSFSIIKKINEIIELLNEQEAEKEKEHNRIIKDMEDYLSNCARMYMVYKNNTENLK